MPVYEYECKACHRDFEYQQRMSDPDKTTCEACGGSLERIISRTAFQLKGGGWYKDLYSSSKPAEAKSEGGGEAKPDAAKTETKTDSSTNTSTSTSTSGEGGSGGSGGTSKAAASPTT